MTRKAPIILLLVLASASLWSQSLQDNEYYRKMVELKTRSEQAFEEGDYGESRRLAEESRSYKDLSDQWIETQLAAYRARSALVRVKDRLAETSRMNAMVNFPQEFEEGSALYDQAYAEFHTDQAYVDSLATSRKALDVLSVIVSVRREGVLPAAYTVRLLPGNTDCLWNIAGYEFIYDDPWSWRAIYEANRDAMPVPDNPDLILPGMVLTIPSLDGETRSGTWVDGEIK